MLVKVPNRDLEELLTIYDHLLPGAQAAREDLARAISFIFEHAQVQYPSYY